MGKSKKFGLGVVIGAVAGVVAGLLTAPKSGKETREDIKNKANEARGSAERKLKEAHKELEKLSKEAKTKAKELKGKAQEEMNGYAQKADELKDRAKAAITSIKSGDDDHDEATIDQVIKDLAALKDKVVKEAKNVVK